MGFIRDIEERGIDSAVRAHQVEIDYDAARARAGVERAIATRAAGASLARGIRSGYRRLAGWLVRASEGNRRRTPRPIRFG
jgi:hypothetical protein